MGSGSSLSFKTFYMSRTFMATFFQFPTSRDTAPKSASSVKAVTCIINGSPLYSKGDSATIYMSCACKSTALSPPRLQYLTHTPWMLHYPPLAPSPPASRSPQHHLTSGTAGSDTSTLKLLHAWWMTTLLLEWIYLTTICPPALASLALKASRPVTR